MADPAEYYKFQGSVKRKKGYVWLLDNGHGGMKNGEYVTAGKRSPVFDDGTQLFEGVFNRDIVKRISKILRDKGVDHSLIVPEPDDMPLSTRTEIANSYEYDETKKKGKRFVSVHANAHVPGDELSFNSANGIETFHFPGSQKGEEVATEIQEKLIEDTNATDRGVKQANFYVLRKTVVPAVLVECGFMTNREECKKLLDDGYRDLIAGAIANAISNLDRH